MPALHARSWHSRWLALDDQRRYELDRWCELNQRLESRPGWFALSPASRADEQREAGLLAIDEGLRAIDRRLRLYLRILPACSAQDIDGVLADVRVAERLVLRGQNDVVANLLSRAARDLAAISCAEPPQTWAIARPGGALTTSN